MGQKPTDPCTAKTKQFAKVIDDGTIFICGFHDGKYQWTEVSKMGSSGGLSKEEPFPFSTKGMAPGFAYITIDPDGHAVVWIGGDSPITSVEVKRR